MGELGRRVLVYIYISFKSLGSVRFLLLLGKGSYSHQVYISLIILAKAVFTAAITPVFCVT